MQDFKARRHPGRDDAVSICPVKHGSTSAIAIHKANANCGRMIDGLKRARELEHASDGYLTDRPLSAQSPTRISFLKKDANGTTNISPSAHPHAVLVDDTGQLHRWSHQPFEPANDSHERDQYIISCINHRAFSPR